MQNTAGELFEQVEEVAGVTYIATSLDNQSMDNLRSLGDTWRQKAASNIFIAATNNGDKANLMVLVDDETIAKGIKAGDLIKPLAKLIGGGGGGRPQMAQAGGKNPAGIPDMLNQVAGEIEKLA